MAAVQEFTTLISGVRFWPAPSAASPACRSSSAPTFGSVPPCSSPVTRLPFHAAGPGRRAVRAVQVSPPQGMALDLPLPVELSQDVRRAQRRSHAAGEDKGVPVARLEASHSVNWCDASRNRTPVTPSTRPRDCLRVMTSSRPRRAVANSDERVVTPTVELVNARCLGCRRSRGSGSNPGRPGADLSGSDGLGIDGAGERLATARPSFAGEDVGIGSVLAVDSYGRGVAPPGQLHGASPG
jgi:hypothetical protein